MGEGFRPPLNQYTLAVFGRIDPHLRRSITFDNDAAFAQHDLLRTMRDMTTWFCDAYASWQKGDVETPTDAYANGCRYRPDIRLGNPGDVLTTNLTHSKCLGFQDPIPSLACRAWKGRSNPLLLKRLRFAPESRLPLGGGR
jgi:hypothetical protein